LREIFLEAAELDDPWARAAYLEAACGNDTSLRQRVEALLEAEAGVGPPPAAAAAAISDVLPGSRIGSYRLQQQIGEGGCGVVFMAEQEQPVRRKVALKIIKLGMDTKQVVARFDAERQALAMMDHPNIARVFDGGATESGRPYFVMELVRGIKITEYCDQQRFPARRRLDLFMQVCHAVQHAHQKGIIHRDLKPSNILVTEVDGRPVPKIIDFGIAKAVSGRLTDQTLFTAFEQLIGTPAYMSPEQAALNAADIDTRSDIYSLGVLLYELLTGETPFDTKALLASGVDELRRTIREVDPVRPSTRLTQSRSANQSAHSGKSENRNQKSEIESDLDWIVMKCLEKERDRRYETANGLAMDIQRHLNCEPVFARPPSRLYEFQKTVRRHKFGFAATATIMLVLVAGVLVSSLHATRARRAELTARANAYASDMDLAQQALANENAREARTLIERHRPLPGEPDLRGWEWRFLWRQLRSDASFTLAQKPSSIHSMAVSADGKWLAVGATRQGGVTVWNLGTHEEAADFPDLAGATVVALSPHSSLLAFATVNIGGVSGGEHKVRVWDLAAHQFIAQILLDSPCEGLGFSPDSDRLVICAQAADEGLIVWNVRDGTEIERFPGTQTGTSAGRTFAIAPDFSTAAHLTSDRALRLVDLDNGQERWRTSHESMPRVTFSSDAKTLAVSDGWNEPIIRVLDVVTGDERVRLQGHRAWISAVVLWPDGKRLASASADQTINVWDLADPAHPKLEGTLRGHHEEVYTLALLSDGRTLVSGGRDGTVCFWDGTVFRRHGVPMALTGAFQAWRFTPDSQAIVTCDWSGRVQRWTGDEFQKSQLLLDFGAASGGLIPEDIRWKRPGWREEFLAQRMALRFSEDARWLATVPPNGIVQVWDLENAKLRRQFGDGSDPGVPWRFLAGGSRLATYHADQSLLRVWDLGTGKAIQSSPVLPRVITGDISRDERWLLMLEGEGQCLLRDLTTERQLVSDLNIEMLDEAAFSPDGRLFAVASDRGFVRLWETRTLREAVTLTGFTVVAHSVGFSPDGTRLAAGGSKWSEILLFDVRSHRKLLRLTAAGSVTRSVTFSPDGSLLGSLDSNGILQLWRAPTWEEIDAAESATGSPLQEPPR
ncbi:MAG TPA: protein kinase, partial [Methylomirabilota bacterium]|nr:protein kinase [Methylomirabilota bacterium]